jgi:hypothetical protein
MHGKAIYRPEACDIVLIERDLTAMAPRFKRKIIHLLRPSLPTRFVYTTMGFLCQGPTCIHLFILLRLSTNEL